MGERDLVSIIIPTRDRGALLTETLESLRRQTYARWEALVMDDGSTDDTAARVAALAAEHARVRFLPRGR